ncbi:uncharacterized protein LOC113495343 isoform X2 [Trichoplusia ni]|nr:uncharacterized protein LOC113495343 isoform X2 [Trichoplusia ni]
MIKSQVPKRIDQKRLKRTGHSPMKQHKSSTTPPTTERSGYIIIPILPEPKSRYQDLYRVKLPPSNKNYLERAQQWYRKTNRRIKIRTTTTTTTTPAPRPEASDDSVYYIDFKNFKVKFYYNINVDF